MARPRLLDLFCCQGGASVGYEAAGFEVVGVDIDPQPRYPLEFHQGDALKWTLEHHEEFDAFHASPPCQAHSNAQKIQGNEHEDFIVATRSLFQLIGKPWVIENVPGAPLRDPIVLCGPMFGLRTYRHRLVRVQRADVRPPPPAARSQDDQDGPAGSAGRVHARRRQLHGGRPGARRHGDAVGES